MLTIYRGQTEGVSAIGEGAYSWTTDICWANFFATRIGNNDSEILIADIPKNKIIEFITDRNEKEILVKHEDVSVKDKIEVWGEKKIAEIYPHIIGRFEKYKKVINGLKFVSEVHGKMHTQRVLLHILILCDLKDIPDDDTEFLCTAAVYHDVGRKKDWVEDEHGKASRVIYEKSVSNPSPIVSFIIEYHSLPDKFGYEEIENNSFLSANVDKVRKLFDIFKDADGLDRVRLGKKDLDINQLRTEESKHLTKVARIFYDRAKDSREYM